MQASVDSIMPDSFRTGPASLPNQRALVESISRELTAVADRLAHRSAPAGQAQLGAALQKALRIEARALNQPDNARASEMDAAVEEIRALLAEQGRGGDALVAQIKTYGGALKAWIGMMTKVAGNAS